MPIGNGIVLNGDPLFVDTANGDYRLSFCSPAINMGSNACYSPDSLPDLSGITTDLDGNPRIHDGIVDLGAYEFQLLTVSFEDTTVHYYETTICYGDTATVTLSFAGNAPWQLVYTQDNGISYDTVHAISDSLFHWKLSPLQTTNYTFIKLQDRNCEHIFMDSITIKVLPKPAFSNSFFNDTLCNGEQTKSVAFTGDITGFQWIASQDTIEGIPITIQTGNFGNYTIENKTNAPLTSRITLIPKYMEDGKICTGEDTAFSITVLPEPILTASLQNDTLCPQEQTTPVTFLGTGTTDYQWTATTAVAGIPTGIQTGNFGRYTVENKTQSNQQSIITVTPQYRLGNIVCSGEEDRFSVFVYPQTEIQSISRNKYIYCEDDTLEIQVKATGGNLSYQWYHNNSLLAGKIENPCIVSMLSKSDNGIYYAEVVGQCGTEKSQNITVTISSDKMLAEKWDDVILVDNSANEYTGYQWYKDNKVIPGATNQFYQEPGGLNGCYSVLLTLANGQKERSCDRCADHTKTKLFNIFPNPIQRGENLQIQTTEEIASVKLYSIEGKLIRTEYIASTLATNNLSQGIYVLIVETKENGIYNKKIAIMGD
jgi:hypothetical protein